jgi:hypothetical protein
VQKFTRTLTREVELDGRRLVVVLDEKGITVRGIGARRPPRFLSWASIACAARRDDEPTHNELHAALDLLGAPNADGKMPTPTTGFATTTANPATSTAPPTATLGLPATLARLETWLQQHRPKYAAALSRGAGAGELAVLAQEIGGLPSSLRELLTWHNGQVAGFHGSFREGWHLLSIAGIHSALNELNDSGHGPKHVVPILADNAGNFIVIEHGGAIREVTAAHGGAILATSLADWLHEFVDAVENGAYHEDPERGHFLRR